MSDDDEHQSAIGHLVKLAELLVPVGRVASWIRRDADRETGRAIDVFDIDYFGIADGLDPDRWQCRNLARLLKQLGSGEADFDEKTVSDMLGFLNGYARDVFRKAAVVFYEAHVSQEEIDRFHDLGVETENGNGIAELGRLVQRLLVCAEDGERPETVRSTAKGVARELERLLPVYEMLSTMEFDQPGED